jgi:ATP-dependent DNA helicase 2 subunit 2
MISKYCKRLKYQRRIVLATDGQGPIDADGKAEISKKIKEDGIELIVVYAK